MLASALFLWWRSVAHHLGKWRGTKRKGETVSEQEQVICKAAVGRNNTLPTCWYNPYCIVSLIYICTYLLLFLLQRLLSRISVNSEQVHNQIVNVLFYTNHYTKKKKPKHVTSICFIESTVGYRDKYYWLFLGSKYNCSRERCESEKLACSVHIL